MSFLQIPRRHANRNFSINSEKPCARAITAAGYFGPQVSERTRRLALVMGFSVGDAMEKPLNIVSRTMEAA